MTSSSTRQIAADQGIDCRQFSAWLAGSLPGWIEPITDHRISQPIPSRPADPELRQMIEDQISQVTWLGQE